MSRKIIGVTVGTQLPKPNFKQTDPTKGDYIRNKPDFEGLKSDVEAISTLVGDTSVATQVSNAIKEITYPVESVNGKTGAVNLTASDVGALPNTTEIPSIEGLATESYVDNALLNLDIPEEIYVQNEEPTDAPDGTIWIDLDDEAHANPEIVIDASLSMEGQAADAKAVGDALAQKQPVGDYALRRHIPEVPVQSVNGQIGNVTITVSNIGAQPAGDYATVEYVETAIDAIPTPDVSGQIGSHNTATDAHKDIRESIQGLENTVAQKSQVQIITWEEND